MRSLCLLSLCFFAVFGSKRTRLEFEIDSTDDEIARIMNILVGSAGSKIDMVRNLVKDEDLRHFFLSLGNLEVEAFDILSSNPSVKIADAVALLNERIPMSRTISKREFQRHRVHFWGYILLQNHSQRTANFITSNTQILTSDDGIEYIQLSDKAWDRIALTWLLQTPIRVMPPPRMPEVHQEKFPNSRKCSPQSRGSLSISSYAMKTYSMPVV